jgi:anti-anti-sigma factor
VTGRIGFDAADDMARAIDGALAAGPRLIVDLEAVDYISSAGAQVLGRAARLARQSGGVVVLTGLRESVRLVLDLTGVLPDLAVEPTQALAIARACA